MQDLQRMLVARDVKLVAGPTVERAALVRADLRCDAESAQQAEGAARDRGISDVEVNRNLTAAAQVDTAGRMKESGELRQAIALAPWSDRRELAAEVLRE